MHLKKILTVPKYDTEIAKLYFTIISHKYFTCTHSKNEYTYVPNRKNHVSHYDYQATHTTNTPWHSPLGIAPRPADFGAPPNPFLSKNLKRVLKRTIQFRGKHRAIKTASAGVNVRLAFISPTANTNQIIWVLPYSAVGNHKRLRERRV